MVTVKLIDMGFVVGRLQYTPDGNEQGETTLIFVAPDLKREEGFITPARSVQIYDKESIIALRDALNDAFPVDA